MEIRNEGNELGDGIKKIIPVKREMQKEISVNYAIAKFRDKGIAFKTETKNAFVKPNARCWIKKGNTIDREEFHITLRFEGVDYRTGEGKDVFDIDIYLPLEEFEEKLKDLQIDTSYKERLEKEKEWGEEIQK